MGFRWESDLNNRTLYYEEQLIGELEIHAGSGMHLSLCDIDEVDSGIFRILLEFLIDTDRYPYFLNLDFKAAYQSQWAMIPAVSYNGNHWGRGSEPKGFIKDGKPWSFSYSRMAVAGAAYSEGDTWCVGLFGDLTGSDAPFSCSLIPETDTTTHRLIWPEEEEPLTYYRRDHFNPGFQHNLQLTVGETFRICAYLVIDQIEQERVSYQKMLDFAWQLNYHEQKPWYDPEKIWELGLAYAQDTLYVEDGIFRGFSKGLRWDGKKWYLRPTAKYLVGWTGQNISLANSMLFSYLKTGNQRHLEIGLNTLDTWVRHAVLDNGLIQCLFDPILTGNQDKSVQDACNLGDAAVNFFEAYELLQQVDLEVDKEVYRETALGICDFAVKHQLPNGNFGKAWSSDGTCVDDNGTIGCYLVLPLLKAYQLTGKQQYFDSARQGYNYYFNSFLRDGFTSAAALDTYCIDKESAIPLLKSSLKFYELTGEKEYLKQAELVSYYLATWQWHYSTPFPKNTPLNELNYDIFGGTSVSVQHHHIDPYALVFMLDWFKLAELTRKDIWRQRAVAVWANASMGVSDGNLVVNGAPRPVGSQDEGFYHTYWGAPNESTGNAMGNVSSWLVAWPTAFRLQVLRHLTDWEQLIQK